MIAFIIDADNFSNAEWVEQAFNLLESKHGTIDVRRAYGSDINLGQLSQVLKKWSVRQYLNHPMTKNTTDMALAVDVMELSLQIPRPTVVAIASGDGDYVPLVVRLREKGIKVICVSESSSLTGDAEAAYNSVIRVKAIAPDVSAASAIELAPAKKPAAKKIAQPKVAASVSPPAAKKVAAKKTSASPTVSSITLNQILDAAPMLRNGQMHALPKVTELLHVSKLIGKSAGSPKLLRKFEGRFELTPEKQPNFVRYVAP